MFTNALKGRDKCHEKSDQNVTPMDKTQKASIPLGILSVLKLRFHIEKVFFHGPSGIHKHLILLLSINTLKFDCAILVIL